MDLEVFVLQHLSESRVLTLAAGLVDMRGKLLPCVFKTAALRNRFLAINKHPLFAIEGAAKKNLFEKKKADE